MEKNLNINQGFDWKKKKERTEGGTLVKTSSTPSYAAGRDSVQTTTTPYAPGLQAGFGPKSSAPDRREPEPEPEPEKQAPRRTSLTVREELETLERSYDDMLQEAEAWESQAASQKTPEKMSQWEKKGRNLRKRAAEPSI